MIARHCCKMAQEMEFGQGWNSQSHTVFNLTLSIYPKGQEAFSFMSGHEVGWSVKMDLGSMLIDTQ